MTSGCPVLITGMHRSGTSMVARMLGASGLHLGDATVLRGPAPDNRHGFFEHSGLVDVADDLLEALGAAWDTPAVIPARDRDDERILDLVEPARSLLQSIERDGPWGWKDPRAMLLVDFWSSLLPELHLVVCVRNPLETAISLKRRNQHSYRFGIQLWDDYYRALLDSIDECGLAPDRVTFTHYASHFERPKEEHARLTGRLALEGGDRLPPDRGMRHNIADVSLEDAGVPASVIERYHHLCRLADWQPDEPAPSGITLSRAHFDLNLTRSHLARRDAQIRSMTDERDRVRDQLDELVRRVDALEAEEPTR